jgi:hypothetical protein
MKKTPWFQGDTHPARRGYYERDHRQCNYAYPEDKRISLDLWEPVKDPKHILYPGVWYVIGEPYWYFNHRLNKRIWMDNINDASRQDLPWRGLTEKAV